MRYSSFPSAVATTWSKLKSFLALVEDGTTCIHQVQLDTLAVNLKDQSLGFVPNI
jgi:hypothetical protein